MGRRVTTDDFSLVDRDHVVLPGCVDMVTPISCPSQELVDSRKVTHLSSVGPRGYFTSSGI